MRRKINSGAGVDVSLREVFGTAITSAKLVRADSAADREKPRAGRRVATEAAQRGKCPKVSFLRKIARGVAIDQVCAEAPHVPLTRLDECADRIFVTRPRCLREPGQFVHDVHGSRPLTSSGYPGHQDSRNGRDLAGTNGGAVPTTSP